MEENNHGAEPAKVNADQVNNNTVINFRVEFDFVSTQNYSTDM